MQLGDSTYLVLSAVFFSLCGYAQLNDPDPLLWAGLYVVAGAVLNASVLSTNCFRVASKLACRLFGLGCFSYAVFLTIHIAKAYGDQFTSLLPHNALWTYVEFEEGREAVGLYLLGAHQFVLLSFLISAPKDNSYKGGAGAGAKKSTTTTNSTSHWKTVVMVGLLAVATYAWIYYQPLMNQRLNVGHCNGAFEAKEAEQTPPRL